MVLSFGGLSIALSSLQTQQRALEIAANNVANAGTAGYSRQAANMTTVGGSVPAIFSTSTGDDSGVTISSVTRFRDAFMEIQAGLLHGSLASLDQTNATMTQIQNVYGEPSDSGIGAQLANFWSSWDAVANNPGDPASRTVLIQEATTLAQSFNTAASSLKQLQSSETTQLGNVVAQVNTTSKSLALINQSIQSGTVAGLNVSSLEDQRDQLAQTLAQLTGATIQSGPNNQITVALGGLNLVSLNQSQALTLDTSGPTAVLRAAQGGFALNVTSGQAGGMLNDINTIIPSYLTQIDGVATTLRDQVNGVMGGISGTLAATSRDQTAAGTLQFNVGLDGGAFNTVSVTGADWSGAGGAAALQTAIQTSLNTAIGTGNATASVTTNTDGSLCDLRSCPLARTRCRYRRREATRAWRLLLGSTPVGSDGIGGRAFFAGTDASIVDRVAVGCHESERGCCRRCRRRRARQQRRPAVRRHGDLHDRCRLGVQHDDRAARCPAKDVQTRDNDPANRRYKASMRPGLLKPGSTPTKR